MDPGMRLRGGVPAGHGAAIGHARRLPRCSAFPVRPGRFPDITPEDA